MSTIEFDIALSFAGEDRAYVDQVAKLLKLSGFRVFYDRFEEEKLWGKNLHDYLYDIYKNKALYTIMFISKHYAKKLWTNHEREAMQARAFEESVEYILPARFDDTPIPGVSPTIGYISLIENSPQELVEKIYKKLRKYKYSVKHTVGKNITSKNRDESIKDDIFIKHRTKELLLVAEELEKNINTSLNLDIELFYSYERLTFLIQNALSEIEGYININNIDIHPDKISILKMHSYMTKWILKEKPLYVELKTPEDLVKLTKEKQESFINFSIIVNEIWAVSWIKISYKSLKGREIEFTKRFINLLKIEDFSISFFEEILNQIYQINE